MEAISIFDIFKIGVGPSSSHTLGPWKAANDYISQLDKDIDRIAVHLFGSLSKTGKGHATDIAVQLGLEGHDSVTISTADMHKNIQRIASSNRIQINKKSIPFHAIRDIVFEDECHDLHPNTLIFRGYQSGQLVSEEIYASTGGGFIEHQGVKSKTHAKVILPYPIQNGKDIIKYTDQQGCRISDIVLKNELYFRSEGEVKEKSDALIATMIDSVYRGCTREGMLPGGLQVKRRAKSICTELLDGMEYHDINEWKKDIRESHADFTRINKWISCFALAVNEENAALSRIVTSPTNGASGVIPAVLLYHYFFGDFQGQEQLERFLYTAGEIGCLFKKGATISAAVGGCQAEIGVSSAMAAAGLTEILGGTPKQVLMAAEIAMEHHLGLTCDPIGGLVQIPCIERNAMGAIKAITASNLAISSNPESAIVHIDAVIDTMWQTAQDMNTKYKETSEGGLALSLPIFMANC